MTRYAFGLVLVIALLLQSFSALADTTFFDNPQNTFIMGNLITSVSTPPSTGSSGTIPQATMVVQTSPSNQTIRVFPSIIQNRTLLFAIGAVILLILIILAIVISKALSKRF